MTTREHLLCLLVATVVVVVAVVELVGCVRTIPATGRVVVLGR